MVDYTLTESDNGTFLTGAPVDGAITSLRMTSPPLYDSFVDNNINSGRWLVTMGGTLDSDWAIINIDLLHSSTIPTPSPIAVSSPLGRSRAGVGGNYR